MEKLIALVRKSDDRVDNVIIVDSLDKNYIKQFETVDCDVIAVKDSIPYLHGLWNGEVFIAPDTAYLISIGLMEIPTVTDEAEAEAKATARQAILDRLGLTADEAALILG